MDNTTSTDKTKESDKENEEMNQNAVCDADDTWPIILNGKYFKIIELDQNRNKVKAMCLTCKEQNKNTVLSGFLRATTNFKVHLKVST